MFFSFVVAPAAFRVLPRPEAGKFVSAVFPVYHTVGLTLSAAAMVIAFMNRQTTPRGPIITVNLWMWLQIAGFVLYGIIRVLRKAHAASEDDGPMPHFSQLHAASMIVNLLALLSALASLLLALR